MKVLFDTSVLVSALVVSHQVHELCLPWLLQAQRGEVDGLVSTHTLAELYSVLTRLPYRPKVRPEQAQQLIAENLKDFDKVVLDEGDYQVAIAQMAQLNLPGGGIFDALIARAAVKADVEVLLTLNAKHFVRLGEDVASRVQTPS